MRRATFNSWLILLAACVYLSPSSRLNAAENNRPPNFEADVQPVLKTYCSKCHTGDKAKGGINLSSYTNALSIYRDVRLWNTLHEKVRERDMPPDGKPQPSAAERDRMILWIEAALKNLDEGRLPKDPGRVLIHRLSRLEYNNTIRDLFGIDSKPADKFPSDGGGGGGFDNNADTLFVPPILMEKYLAAADDVLATATNVIPKKAGLFATDRSLAGKAIDDLGSRAFRRPLEKEEKALFLSLYDRSRASGAVFDESVKLGLKTILISPQFLFRIENDQTQKDPYRISDYELATRLSYFLWSSMPDQELFRLAAKNRLHETNVLEKQVVRMLRDPKAHDFADNFAGQWLRVRELRNAAQPDARRFPTYNKELREAMYQEPIELFYSILKDDASLLGLLDADYTFLNETLARHYGITNVLGNQFQRVALEDRNRGGVLGMAGVLTLTSYPQRTSPVLRGKWVLEEILGTPPPPPPPMVKSLPTDDKPTEGLTLRQRLEQHRNKPECATCHKRMDPLGFALENFDPIGRWRTEISGKPVDAAGELPDGKKFSGAAELKSVLLENKKQFIHNLTEKMLAYGLGRGLEYYDIPAVRKIADKVVDQDCRATVLIMEIVKSYPFQFRRNQPVPMEENAHEKMANL